jgi:ABC-type iron transport system FetAB ATPase subunit
MPRLTVRDLTFFGHGPYHLTVEAGGCVGLTGPSGAGKTLFLRAVADLDPHGGAVALDGTDAAALPAPAWRRRVALLPAAAVWWRPRVGDHFPPGWGTNGSGGYGPDTLGLPDDVPAWPVGRLSAGERQRLALLRLLARRPDCLLLDEPTANLDLRAAARVEAAVARYRKEAGAPVVWVAHDPAQLKPVADRVVTLGAAGLSEGLAEGGPAEEAP